MSEHKGWHQRGYLPHLDAAAIIQHVTFRLQGSLPAAVVERLKTEADGSDYRTAIDGELDKGFGHLWLADPDCAALVVAALRKFDGQRYELLAWCVMPNHVHVLIRQAESWSLGPIVKSWKTYTARMINRRLERTGHLWAADYFDRYTRDENQLIGAIRYIEANPVKAGLCATPEDWPFSSAATLRGRQRLQSASTTLADLEVRAPFILNR